MIKHTTLESTEGKVLYLIEVQENRKEMETKPASKMEEV